MPDESLALAPLRLVERMIVEVEWTWLEQRDWLWHDCLCLYAYADSNTGRILYLGKADYQTVTQRLYGRHKEGIFTFCHDGLGVKDLGVLHGGLLIEEGRRRSSHLLSDVESLLIMRLKPPGNIACTRSRIRRPGLRVRCFGDWPHRRASFYDY